MMATKKDSKPVVLLLWPDMRHYKLPIVNKLSKQLGLRGRRLVVWCTENNMPADEIEFDEIILPMTFGNYRKVIKEQKVDHVINFLLKKDPGFFFYIYSALYPRFKGVEVFYYGHGSNLGKGTQLDVFANNLLHLLFNKIIIYSPLEKKDLWPVNARRATVAFNTLDLEGCREKIKYTVDEIRKVRGITERHAVLFSGRIQPRKRLAVLLDIFLDDQRAPADTALIVVGPGMDKETQSRIESSRHVHYLGPVYDQEKMSEIFFASDIFCIPGAMGLGLVEALYWGLPVVSLVGRHGPERYYLREGENSFLVNSEDELASAINRLIADDNLRVAMSANAKRVMDEEGTLKNMFSGFYEALGLMA